MKAKITKKNIGAYLAGNVRYYVWYHKNKKLKEKLIRPHIMEQIEFRLLVMESDCYNKGACVMCGCRTTALQMANKACDKPCYPPMMNKKDWDKLINKGEEVRGWKVSTETRRIFSNQGNRVDQFVYIHKDEYIVHTKHLTFTV
jgi:hypothetical protein